MLAWDVWIPGTACGSPGGGNIQPCSAGSIAGPGLTGRSGRADPGVLLVVGVPQGIVRRLPVGVEKLHALFPTQIAVAMVVQITAIRDGPITDFLVSCMR